MRVERAEHQGIDVDPGGGLGGGQQFGVVDAPAAVLVKLLAQAFGLGAVAGHLEVAALDDVGVDALAIGDGDHLIDRLIEHPLPGDHCVAAVLPGQHAAVTRGQAGQPAAVAPGGAEPGEAGFEHGDPQARVELLEVVGRPQSGVAGADDADVGLAVPGQRTAGGRQAVEPVRHRAVLGHARTVLTSVTRVAAAGR